MHKYVGIQIPTCYISGKHLVDLGLNVNLTQNNQESRRC